MLKVVDEKDFNAKLLEEDINNLIIDPLHGILQMTKVVSKYTLKLEIWTFYFLKIFNLKCRSIEGKIEELEGKNEERGLKEKEVEKRGNLELIKELKKKINQWKI